MDRGQFDALARLVWARQSRRAALATVFGAALLGPSLHPTTAKPKPKDKRQRKRNQRKHRHQERQYPVFTTCHTETEELGPIPGGPYPTCQSRYDPDEFVPCDTRHTFRDLQQKCNDEFQACNGDCRILAEPIVGLGDCPDYHYCDYLSYAPDCKTVTVGPIPGGPYGSCWSWWNPFMRCWSCPGHTPDYNGMVALCDQEYSDVCNYEGQNICFPSDVYGPAQDGGVGCVG